MAKTMDYHCPNCGGVLAFDAVLQKLTCPYCDSAFSPEEFRDKDDVLIGQTELGSTQEVDGHTLSFDGDGLWDGETDHINLYSCQNCGAQIIAEESTVATHCPYCGNVVVMTGKLSGDYKPDYVIPFQVTKKQAVDAFRDYLKQAKYVPKVFSKKDHPEEIKGVYVPFWLFDVDVDADAVFEAEKVRTWSNGRHMYVERKYYELHRAGLIAMRKVPVDGSKKMADDLMESIEPFDFKEAVPFQTAYLAGYLADRYDVEYGDCIERASERMRNSATSSLKNTAHGYTTVRLKEQNCEWKNANISYVLYPVWLLSTEWNGDNYLFAMNGQTKKFSGELPFDKKAFWRHKIWLCLIVSAIFFAIIMSIMLFG